MTDLIEEPKREAKGNVALPRVEKVNYAIGDFGNNIVWNMLGIYLAAFYTDVYGLDPWHMGTMFLVVRIFDAITDPLVGMWADRAQTRFGKYRPFILFGAIPLAISFVMLFYTPALGETGKIVYAYFSYALLTLAYTIVNVPYSAMVGSLSGDSGDRTSIQSYRFGIGYMASVLVAAVALPLVRFFGDGDDKSSSGYVLTAATLSLLIVACLFYCFKTVKENVLPDREAGMQSNGSFASQMKIALSNGQLLVILVLNSFFVITFMLRASMQIYYMENVMVDAGGIKTTFLTLGTVAMASGAALSSFLWGRFDKPNIYRNLMIALAVATGVLYWVPGTALWGIVALWLIGSFLTMSAVPICWSMVSDVVDYQRSLNGKIMSGLIFALFLFTTKLGVGVGGALIGWILSASGYEAGVAQSVEAINAINATATLGPSALFVLSIFVMRFYKLNRVKCRAIQQELEG